MSLESVTNIGFADTSSVAKVLAELQGLTFNVVAGATGSAMTVPNLEIEDTIVKIVNLTTPAEITLANCAIVDRRAHGHITVLTTVVDGDYVTVNGKRYTFTEAVISNAYNPPPFVVPIEVTPSGVDDEAVALELSKAIMSGDSTMTCTVAGPIVTVIYRTPGTGGNIKTLTTSSGHCTVSGATLGEGTATSGFTCSDGLSGSNLLVVWYNKQ